MGLSSKGDYGIRALVDLAQNQGRGPIPAGEIAARQGIPESLVGQVLGTLRLAGYVRSVRGAQGGHELARDPAKIRLHEVVENLEGPIAPGVCAEDINVACTGSVAQAEMWEEVRRSIVQVLERHTVAKLAAQTPTTAGGRYVI